MIRALVLFGEDVYSSAGLEVLDCEEYDTMLSFWLEERRSIDGLNWKSLQPSPIAPSNILVLLGLPSFMRDNLGT